MTLRLEKPDAAETAKNHPLPDLLLIARALITDEQRPGEVLLVRRKKDSAHNGGQWELPGGKIDCDEQSLPLEDFAQAVDREVREETGLPLDVISEGQFIEGHEIYGGTHDGAISLTFVGRAAVRGGTIRLDNESSAADWFHVRDLPDNLTEISRLAIAEMARDLPLAA